VVAVADARLVEIEQVDDPRGRRAIDDEVVAAESGAGKEVTRGEARPEEVRAIERR
jgi:hypothetical protein